jgi:hypothetical protein
MRKEELERHAAAMRARHATTATKVTIAVPVEAPSRRTAVLAVPALPSAGAYSLLGGVWKPSDTKLLIAALGPAHPLVLRTARCIGSQQVAFDGLVSLRGDGVLDTAVSTRMLPEALRQYNRLVQAVVKRGGGVTVTDDTTVLLRGESIAIRMREGSDKRVKRIWASGYKENEWSPNGQLPLVDRLPARREKRKEREREIEEEWKRRQLEWRAREEEQRQWKEQQERFDVVTLDVEKWGKAERIRAYAAAFEAQHVARCGAIKVGSPVDGWLRWIHWYAEHVDPLTRPEGSKEQPDDENTELEDGNSPVGV